VRAGKKAALLVGAAIDSVWIRIFANAAVMQQRRAFSRCAVASDSLPFLCRGKQEIKERQLCFFHLLRKCLVSGNGIQPGFLFHLDQRFHARLDGVRGISTGSIYAQRTAVSGDFLNVNYFQAVRLQNGLGGQQGE